MVDHHPLLASKDQHKKIFRVTQKIAMSAEKDADFKCKPIISDFIFMLCHHNKVVEQVMNRQKY